MKHVAPMHVLQRWAETQPIIMHGDNLVAEPHSAMSCVQVQRGSCCKVNLLLVSDILHIVWLHAMRQDTIFQTDETIFFRPELHMLPEVFAMCSVLECRAKID